jgi:hypothetical protein
MALLHIALQEGFTGEPLRISVDGQEIFNKDLVRTRPQIGHADHIDTQHAPGPVTIVVTARGSSATITHTLTGDAFIGVSITPDGHIIHRVSQDAFRYM